MSDRFISFGTLEVAGSASAKEASSLLSLCFDWADTRYEKFPKEWARYHSEEIESVRDVEWRIPAFGGTRKTERPERI